VRFEVNEKQLGVFLLSVMYSRSIL